MLECCVVNYVDVVHMYWLVDSALAKVDTVICSHFRLLDVSLFIIG